MANESPTEFNVDQAQTAAEDAATGHDPRGESTGGSNSILSANGLEARWAVLESYLNKAVSTVAANPSEVPAVEKDIQALMGSAQALVQSPTILTMLQQMMTIKSAVADISKWIQSSSGETIPAAPPAPAAPTT